MLGDELREKSNQFRKKVLWKCCRLISNMLWMELLTASVAGATKLEVASILSGMSIKHLKDFEWVTEWQIAQCHNLHKPSSLCDLPSFKTVHCTVATLDGVIKLDFWDWHANCTLEKFECIDSNLKYFVLALRARVSTLLECKSQHRAPLLGLFSVENIQVFE